MSGVVQLIDRAGGNLCSLQVFVCNVKSPFLAGTKWVSPILGWGPVFIKAVSLFRIVCVYRGGQCVLCCAGYFSLHRAGTSVTVGSFSLGPSANKVPLRCLAVALKTLSFESSPHLWQGKFFLLALRLQIGAAFLCCIQMLVIRPCCPYCCLYTFLPAFPKAVFQSLCNTWFKHPSSVSCVLGCFSHFWRRIILWVRR